MLKTFANAWKIEELRKKILFTLMVIVVLRIGTAIPVPFISSDGLKALVGDSGNLLGYFDMLTGGSFSQATIFALSVTPYINASIIMQLLTVAIPALERLSKEGEVGRRKITRITRYVGAGFAVALSVGFYFLLRAQGTLIYDSGISGIFAALVIIVAFAAGSMLIQWLGEQIDANGIGNGISILIFAGIVSGLPSAISMFYQWIQLAIDGQTQYLVYLPIVLILTLAILIVIVILNAAERRIPIQYAKRVVGRKMMGGQNTYFPIKVNMSGVMPVIFASALISIPGTIGDLFFSHLTPQNSPFWYSFFNMFSTTGMLYAVLYLLLIVAFNFFYVSMQYNPIEIANNLRNNNGTIPGYRPGQPTSDFITKCLSKITFIGAAFLGIVAVAPILFSMATNVNIQLGGTSLLIVVGVALDTSRSLESYMLMRHHKGFLE